MEEQSVESWGRQIFFLYPHPVVQEELLSAILEQEYEVYFVKDHERLLALLRNSSKPVLVLNIDAEVKGLKWIDYARTAASIENGVKLAALTYREDRALAQAFVNELGCELVLLKAGVDDSRASLLKMLSDSRAIGKRKYVRARCGDAALASFNVRYGSRFHAGVIKDLSSAGFAGTFSTGLRLSAETYLADIQLRLRGRLVRVSGTVALTRQEGDGPEVYVVLFDRNVTPETKVKLRLFIHEVLQSELDRSLATGSGNGAKP